eukprot:TRINITY_DN124_c0_g1_i1.p1 TRINITY_DN124_c0_g1~~TRINITY_DN124_c0_g1_i1.p1  ORF type:complete len:421 (+),score=55.32 TRINITY_DN124_c0_g1_i1:43-1305(+)
MLFFFFFFQAEDGIRDHAQSRGLGDVYKRQLIDRLVEQLSKQIGLPSDQLLLIATILTTIPFGFIFQFIKNPFQRHLSSTLFGFFLQYLIFRQAMISNILQTIIVYILISVFKEKCGKIVFIESFVFLGIHQIYFIITSYGGYNMDITTILLMNMCKFTSIAFNVVDGQRNQEELSEFQKKCKLTQVPKFFDYFSYIYFFGSSIMGPSFDYADYVAFINREKQYANMPFSGMQTLKHFLQFVLFSLVYVGLSPIFPMSAIIDPDFKKFNLLYKLVYLQIATTIYRFKYYSGLTIAQVGICSTGITYNGQNAAKQHLWNNIESIDPVSCELDDDIRKKIASWNISVQKWLRRYIYERVCSEKELKTNKKKAERAQMATMMASALWHGYYPGYYICFFQLSIAVSFCKKLFIISQYLSLIHI